MSEFDGFENPKENYSKLPHQLIKELHRFSSLAELKIVLYTLRHTWGYHDDYKKITLDEFENGRKERDGTRIDDGIGMTRPSIVDGIKRAIKDGFLFVHTDTQDSARTKKYYSLTSKGLKNFTPDVKKFNTSSKEILPRTEKDTEKETKETNGETSFSQSFETLIINELSHDTWLSESDLASKIGVSIDDLSQIVASHPAQVTLEMLVDRGTIAKSQRIGDTSERHYQIATSQDKTKPTIISGGGKKNYRQTLIEAIENIMKVSNGVQLDSFAFPKATKPSEGLYVKTAKTLIESGIPLEQFQEFYEFVVSESENESGWQVRVHTLTGKTRPDRFIAQRDNPSEDYLQDEIEVYGF